MTLPGYANFGNTTGFGSSFTPECLGLVADAKAMYAGQVGGAVWNGFFMGFLLALFVVWMFHWKLTTNEKLIPHIKNQIKWLEGMMHDRGN